MVFSIAMSGSRWINVLVIAAILGLLAPHAGARERRGARAPAAAVPANPDEAFIAARQAALQGNAEKFEAAAPIVSDPLLGGYLDYWRLRLRLYPKGVLQTGDDPGLDADLQAYLARTDNPLLVDLARRDWLYRLARRADWSSFETHYGAWVLRDESALHCYGGLARVERGGTPGEEAREALMQARELGDACGALADAMARTGQWRRADVWRRLKFALEAGAHGSVRRLAALAGLPVGAVEAAIQRPATVLGPGVEREVAVIAFGVIARQNPESAAGRTEELAALPAEERAWVWSQIVAHSQRKLAPVAPAWIHQAMPAHASDETLAWLIRAGLRAGDWRAVHAFTEHLSPVGRREPAWIYWQARAHRALGRTREAQEGLRSIAGQFHFYGQLASEDLGEPFHLPPPAAPSTEPERQGAAGNPAFARALRFYELGLRPEGNREWNFQLRGMSDRQLLAAARFACERKVLDRCVNTADRTRQEHDFTLRFVMPFRPQLEAAAAERGLDPAWAYGLIRQESRFIMDARSSAAAQGLMQIIPPTARWIARRLGVNDFRLEQLNELDTNLRFGTYYLRTVQDDLEGSALLASAGYNAGPNRPRQWRAALPGTVEGAVFAELVPFTETRDYVKKVLSNATFYATLMTGQPQSLKQRLGKVAPAALRPSDLP